MARRDSPHGVAWRAMARSVMAPPWAPMAIPWRCHGTVMTMGVMAFHAAFRAAFICAAFRATIQGRS